MAVTVTPGLVAGALTNFRSIFQNAFDAARNLQPWRDIALTVPSTTNTETHSWLGTVPTMKDTTKGDLEIENLYAFDYSITNKVWKAAFEVPRAFFEDEKLGMVTPKIQQLAEEAARHPGQLIFQLPITNPNAFDALAFIADTRVIGRSANIDNLRGYAVAAGATGIPTVAEFQAGIATARGVMRAFQDDNGRPQNLIGNTLMIPPDIEHIAYQALNASLVPGSVNLVTPATADGTFTASGYRVIVNPYLTEANDFYLIHASGFGPFIFQERTAPTLEPLTQGTTNAVVADDYIYSVRYRGEVGVGDPRHIVKVVGA